MMVTFRPPPWPSSVWTQIPNCAWVTLARSVVPYIWIRRRGRPDEEVRLPVGQPFPLDPDCDYEVKNVSDARVDLIATPAASDAILKWFVRDTELVCSDRPVPGGLVNAQWQLQNANAAGVILAGSVRFLTQGLKHVTVVSSCNGTVTAAGVYGYDPRGHATQLSGYAQYIPAGSANVSVPHRFNMEGTGYLFDAAAQYSRGFVPYALGSYIQFAVTTTPTVCQELIGVPL